jgi:hypothetical protein
MTEREGRRDTESRTGEELEEQAHLEEELVSQMESLQSIITEMGASGAAGLQVVIGASSVVGAAADAAARATAGSRPSHFPGERGEPVQIQAEAVELDDAYYDEVRQAVGRGTPSVLLGTSTRSLGRNLAEIRTVERGDHSPGLLTAWPKSPFRRAAKARSRAAEASARLPNEHPPD